MGNIDYTKLFEYYEGKDQYPDDAFKISPSSIEDFFSSKVSWYRENLLGEDKRFTGSTSSVLGTCVHAAAEVVAEAKRQGLQHDSEALHDAVSAYIETFNGKEGYDTSYIHANWKSMAELLIKEYVLPTNTIATENFIINNLTEKVYVGGTYDAITSSAPTDTIDMVLAGTHVGSITVRDYKTASSKPSSFSWKYTLQAFTYAYILTNMGIKVDNVELCFVVRPTKTLPARVFNFTKCFGPNEFELIEGILNLIAESVDTWNEYPDCRYLLAGDYRLKNT